MRPAILACAPERWETLTCEDFSHLRRKTMAAATRAGYLRLSDPVYNRKIEGAAPVDASDLTLADLVAVGLLKPRDLIQPGFGRLAGHGGGISRRPTRPKDRLRPPAVSGRCRQAQPAPAPAGPRRRVRASRRTY